MRAIREFLQQSEEYNNWSALQLEFKIWPEIQRELAAETFLASLGKKFDKSKSIMEKYQAIICELSHHIR